MLPSEVRDLHLRSGQPVSRKGYDFNQRENFKFYRDNVALESAAPPGFKLKVNSSNKKTKHTIRLPT